MEQSHHRANAGDAVYWKRQVRCQEACPVHTDVCGYVRAIAEGDLERAYLIARGPNPLASICGRICGAPCEAACRRGQQIPHVPDVQQIETAVGEGDRQAARAVIGSLAHELLAREHPSH